MGKKALSLAPPFFMASLHDHATLPPTPNLTVLFCKWVAELLEQWVLCITQGTCPGLTGAQGLHPEVLRASVTSPS